MNEQLQIVWDSLTAFWVSLGEFLPQVIGAVVILIVGWIVAKILRKVVIKLLKVARLNTAAEKAGIEGFLTKGGVKFTTVELIGNLFYWFVMFAVILAVFNSLNLTVAAELFNKIVLYIPNVFVAVIVLVFGAMFATFIQGVLGAYLKNVGFGGAETVTSIAKYAIVVFVVFAALEQLKIGGEILVSGFQIAFAAICAALALAFGLGGKDWAAQILAGTPVSTRKKPRRRKRR
ncbi:MAG: hypothetical protein KAJ12_15400 [Bacteroidetes bacterium]|nr:hypothetical protein [Bacteroidota bacterium]